MSHTAPKALAPPDLNLKAHRPQAFSSPILPPLTTPCRHHLHHQHHCVAFYLRRTLTLLEEHLSLIAVGNPSSSPPSSSPPATPSHPLAAKVRFRFPLTLSSLWYPRCWPDRRRSLGPLVLESRRRRSELTWPALPLPLVHINIHVVARASTCVKPYALFHKPSSR